ncbi:alpha/beta hydrolase [Actinacidiphila acidipaludis]|uniref:Alpha/beta hydrolase n=1 Tax=Actinacidiphila acidipaludis TaxID=2873382 RepID=A0ABS7QB63_9ACTN|nr:alpha/beta hydrolase [Streptomyces acidipaludis]MBY8880347.1 alpha/beta hydrolase [Streptomyces acidipaludis]
MRLRTGVVLAATAAVGAGTAALAVGRYGSGFALKPSVAGPAPEGLITVHAVDGDWVVLTRTTASARPGVYGLSGTKLHATVGPVAGQDAYSVTRRLLRVDRGALGAGGFVRMTSQAYEGDPRSARDLDFADVQVPGELGPMPAWFLPGARRTWVICVHGVGATREQALPVLPALHRFRFPVLVPSYRNDPGAPPSPDGIAHLGDTEWSDLDSAMRHAVDQGAEHIVLYGWSTGATMALRALSQSTVRGRVSGLVLDSPVLDWRSTVRASVRTRGLPAVVSPLAERTVEGRTGLHAARHTEALEPERLTVPTLIVHGPDDHFAPYSASHRLAEQRPDVVTLHTVPDAPHAAMWNADPDGYEETLRRFLTPLM